MSMIAEEMITTMQSVGGRTPLQPKRLNSNTGTRLQLKAHGYDIIPLNANKIPFKGWPTQPNDEAAIRKWGGLATGLRMKGHDIFVFDIDVRIEAVRDDIVAAWTERWPEFMAGCLRRHSGAVTLALIGRCCTAKRSYATSRFYSGPEDKKGHLVEFFTGNDKRQVVVQGRHSEGREYGYIGATLWETPPETLPWFPDEDIGAALHITEAIMKKYGLERQEKVDSMAGVHKLFDLEPAMEFTLADGSVVTLAELEDDARAGLKLGDPKNPCSVNRLAGYATIWDSRSSTRNRVLVNYGSTGLCLWDTKTGISHRWKHCEPPKESNELAERLRKLVKEAWS
jgi:hypothetical protein